MSAAKVLKVQNVRVGDEDRAGDGAGSASVVPGVAGPAGQGMGQPPSGELPPRVNPRELWWEEAC